MGTYNLLFAEMDCPRCGKRSECEIEIRSGDTSQMQHFHIGDDYPCRFMYASRSSDSPGQADLIGDGYTECPACRKDFFVTVQILLGVIQSASVDHTRPGYIL